MEPPFAVRDPVVDALGRPLGSLRLSLTDVCNLRCSYCMPEEHYTWLPRADILTGPELVLIARAFRSLGVDRIRLTGGEPLLRPDAADIVALLHDRVAPADLAMTTNATQLRRYAATLAASGLDRVTVSLDTLRPDRFERLTRRTSHGAVLDGIAAAREASLGLKLNTVVMRDINDDEVVDMLGFADTVGAEVRFIEYMDVGGATGWDQRTVVTKAEILDRVRSVFGPIGTLAPDGAAPANRYRLPNGSTFGIIASVSEPFCRTCDRSRITADGTWLRCLYATTGTDLRRAVRDGTSPADLAALIRATWQQRVDRGAEERSKRRIRIPLVSVEALQDDPHLEMHTRGG